MRLFWDNLIRYSGVTITASSEGSDLPDHNVQDTDRGKVWRTGASTAAEWIKFDLGSAKAVQALILLDHTLTVSDSTIKLQGNATDSWGSPSVDEALTFNADTILKVLTTAQTYRWWRVIFTKSAAGETRDIGCVYLGPLYECAVAPRLPDGYKVKPVDLSKTNRALSGKTYSEIRERYDEITVEFPPNVPDAMVTELKNLHAACGTHTPFYVQVEPTNYAYTSLHYGKLTELVGREVHVPIPAGTAFYWKDVAMKMAEEV